MNTYMIESEGCGCCATYTRVREVGRRTKLDTGQELVMVKEIDYEGIDEGKLPYWAFQEDLGDDFYSSSGSGDKLSLEDL